MVPLRGDLSLLLASTSAARIKDALEIVALIFPTVFYENEGKETRQDGIEERQLTKWRTC